MSNFYWNFRKQPIKYFCTKCHNILGSFKVKFFTHLCDWQWDALPSVYEQVVCSSFTEWFCASLTYCDWLHRLHIFSLAVNHCRYSVCRISQWRFMINFLITSPVYSLSSHPILFLIVFPLIHDFTYRARGMTGTSLCQPSIAYRTLILDIPVPYIIMPARHRCNQARRGYSDPSGSAVPRRHDPRSSPWPQLETSSRPRQEQMARPTSRKQQHSACSLETSLVTWTSSCSICFSRGHSRLTLRRRRLRVNDDDDVSSHSVTRWSPAIETDFEVQRIKV